LLAGRKLLLADDSVTIQKVIDLTFADEGVRVVAFSNGQDAIDALEEIAPDIVLADVFMPNKNGYEVCEYIKNHEKLKRTPVMLLVGSFEPFDEAEARRVGADDILTKPFQSIRRLIDRVGALVNNPPVEKERPTAELPKSAETEPEADLLDTHELEITTADTRPLQDVLEAASPVVEDSPAPSEEIMERAVNEVNGESLESADALLDLGDYETVQVVSDDFELDLDETYSDSAPVPVRAFVEPEITEAVASVAASGYEYEPPVLNDAFEETQKIEVHEVVAQPEPQPVEPVVQATSIDVNSIPQEVIDQIARRAVEMLSAKVVQEIAWEVVPDLAELMIKRQLEEHESQTK
jgi:CheY-like chemotaxis protein